MHNIKIHTKLHKLHKSKLIFYLFNARYFFGIDSSWNLIYIWISNCSESPGVDGIRKKSLFCIILQFCEMLGTDYGIFGWFPRHSSIRKSHPVLKTILIIQRESNKFIVYSIQILGL